MDLPVTLALVLGSLGVLLLFLYRYLTRNYGYWEAQGLPTIKPRLFYGSNKEIFNKTPPQVEEERYEKYGRMYGTYEFLTRAVNIADPQLAHQVLVKDFHIFTNRRNFQSRIPIMDKALSAARDETWKRIRTVVSPSFTSGKMRKMNPHFVDATEGLISNFLSAEEAKEPVDMKKYFSSFSMDVFGLCVLGIRVDSLKNPNHPFIVNARKLFARNFSKLVMLMLFILPSFQIFGRLALKKMGINYIMEVCEEIIRKRKEVNEISTTKQVDFVQLMLDAREGKGDVEEKEEAHLGHFHQADENSIPRPAWNITKTLSDLEIHAQTIQFFSVGHETISTALAMAALELALNPGIQETLHKEIQEAFETHGGFDYDVVLKMPYLEAVVCETLRLHTVALRLEREASEDYMLGSTGVKVPKGALVMILVHTIHHDPEWYPDPFKFDPTRFLPENQSSLTPYTFLPFGDGPRNCVAMRFALLEIKLCLAMVLRRIKFVATQETKCPVEFYKGGILIPKEVKMQVESRV